MVQQISLNKDRSNDVLRLQRSRYDLTTITTTLMIAYLAVNQLYYIVFNGSSSSLLDEGLLLLIIVPALMAIVTSPILRLPSLLFLGYAVASLLSIYTAGFSGVPQPKAGLIDVALDAKILLFVAGFYLLLKRSNNPQFVVKAVCYFVILIAILNSCVAIRDIFSGGTSVFGSPLEVRGGFFQPQGFQSHKVRSAAVTMLAAVFSWSIFAERRSMIILLIAMYLSVFIVLHQSAKEIVAFAIVLVFLAPGGRTRGLKPVLAITATIAFGGVLLFTPIGDIVTSRVGQFTGVSGNDKARTVLLTRSVEIARDHFPLGTGAGTYGSGPSYQMGYSSVYYHYGLAYIWGSSPSNPAFLQDTFWAKIVGQSGFLGSLFYAFFLFAIFRYPFAIGTSYRRGLAIPGFGIVVLSLITSLASSPFAEDFIGVILALFSAFYMVIYEQRRVDTGDLM